jgi:hypothetical protein
MQIEAYNSTGIKSRLRGFSEESLLLLSRYSLAPCYSRLDANDRRRARDLSLRWAVHGALRHAVDARKQNQVGIAYFAPMGGKGFSGQCIRYGSGLPGSSHFQSAAASLKCWLHRALPHSSKPTSVGNQA